MCMGIHVTKLISVLSQKKTLKFKHVHINVAAGL